MSVILVQGYHPLKGEIEIQGSKNAALPMMAAAILHKGTTVLKHVPRIQDVYCMMGILESMGCSCVLKEHTLTVDAKTIRDIRIPEENGKAMRSSIMVLGALLGRRGEAYVHYPGGCSIGSRPIDMHIEALKQMGAHICEEEGILHARALELRGTSLSLPYPSVGATENVILAAVAAKGITTLKGAAMEPEVEALCRMLNAMGANISGIGTNVLVIRGGSPLRDSQYDVPGDRIVAGTYLSAVMAAGGEAVLKKGSPEHLSQVLETGAAMGARIQVDGGDIRVAMEGRPKAMSIATGPYPGFPTDLQSMMLVLMSLGQGQSRLKETVFEGRFATAKELRKMGAGIIIEGKEALVSGKRRLKGTRVRAHDLRGGAALVTAGLAADGETCITHCHHIFRGYEDICRDLKNLGADIRREG
ncbi:MAG: UDP-N-acetylglucosamine 1-carboxyvinyltransferase [Hungatella sp.]|nr:UDP-N-acetylglucosamine 1-carboxyvinyltransferase [Hungatella sp.]MCI9635680.1 UDP-N-acetylglucosamine 1-carboxyvinyltransferase [Hungatella sp.]